MTDQEKIQSLEAQIAVLQKEVAPFKKWDRWDWFAFGRLPARRLHIEAMREKGLLAKHSPDFDAKR